MALGSFELDLQRFGEKAVQNAEKVVKKIGLDMHSRIVQRMPVATGRARANTSISIGDNPGTSTTDTDKHGGPTIAKNKPVAEQFKIGDSITIYNNVEYIVPLEYGHSKLQAPQGMFRITFLEVANRVGAYAREVNT